jgi:peroxiredoxin
MKKRGICCGIVAFFIVFAGLIVVDKVKAATPMPSFSLQNVKDGKIVNSQSLKGKVILLSFFATWCPPCAEEIPILVKLHREMESAGFSVIGLSVDQQGPAEIAKFVEKKAINYPVLLAEARTADDFGGIYSIPVAFLINKTGNVVKRYSGFINHAVLERDIKSLLN